MSMVFTKATRKQAKARLLLEGASGSGKTEAALALATVLADGKRFAVIDTEEASASLYSDRYDFDTLNLAPPFEPERFVEAIKTAENAGYDVIVIDGISPEWNGAGGCLEIKDKLGGKYQDWAKVNPRHDKFVQSMLRSKSHIVATCRAKTGYAMEEGGKKVTKVGLEPQQRDGLDFEMTTVWLLNQNHLAIATKDRTRLFDGRDTVITAETGQKLMAWLNSGEAQKAAETSPAQPISQDLSDDAKFATEVLSALRGREFDMDSKALIDAAVDAACKLAKVQTLNEVPVDRRAGMVKFIQSGKLDNIKNS